MKQEKLLDALSGIDPEYIEQAAPVTARKRRGAGIWIGLAACLLTALAAAAFLRLKMPGVMEADPTAISAGEPADSVVPAGTDKTAEGFHPGSAEGQEYSEESKIGKTARETLLAYSFGPMRLGMPLDELTALYGEPDVRSNSGPVTLQDGIARESWGYRISGVPDGRVDFTLGLANDGTGWVLNQILLWTNCGLELPHGIHVGMTREELLAAWPEMEEQFAYQDGAIHGAAGTHPTGFYHQGDGELQFSIRLKDEIVDMVTLGPYYRYPSLEEENGETEELPYSFVSGTVAVWTRGDAGWKRADYEGRDAKLLEVQFSIQDLVPLSEDAGEAAYLVDFRNGTAAAVLGSNEHGAVYRIEDEQAFQKALEAGVFTSDAMTLLERCVFPAGVWNLLETLSDR
ncbi:MAG: hypothetical protein J6P31_05845 [Oscillospiraceae bacterium]|nr:hypothetical protein [Oscillospiraceae bacterium]